MEQFFRYYVCLEGGRTEVIPDVEEDHPGLPVQLPVIDGIIELGQR